MPVEEHYVETDEGRVYCEVEGDPAAELVLLAAGGPGTSHDHYHPWFSRLLPELRVTSLDPAYQELVALVLPDLEWVDPFSHPPLNRPDHDRGFEPAVYEAVAGRDPEWEVTGTLRGHDRSAELGRLPDTLVLTGRYDRLTPPEIAYSIHAALAPERRALHVFERSAHRPWVEEPDAYFAAVKSFLLRR